MIKYQHTMNSPIEHNPPCISYLINDEARDLWISHLSKHSHYAPSNLSSIALIDQEVDSLTQLFSSVSSGQTEPELNRTVSLVLLVLVLCVNLGLNFGNPSSSTHSFFSPLGFP
jgi:hypothetical protein